MIPLRRVAKPAAGHRFRRDRTQDFRASIWSLANTCYKAQGGRIEISTAFDRVLALMSEVGAIPAPPPAAEKFVDLQ